MTNVEGVLNKEKKLISEISSSKILEMIKDGTITGGMIPKINTCSRLSKQWCKRCCNNGWKKTTFNIK